MKQLKINLIALALGLALSAGTMAHSLSNNGSPAGQGSIAVEYKSAATPMKIANATAAADETTAAALNLAAARRAATTIRLDAMYEVEKERCNAYPVATKVRCLRELKAGFGKP